MLAASVSMCNGSFVSFLLAPAASPRVRAGVSACPLVGISIDGELFSWSPSSSGRRSRGVTSPTDPSVPATCEPTAMSISMDIGSSPCSSSTAERLMKDVNELNGEDSAVCVVCGPIELGHAKWSSCVNITSVLRYSSRSMGSSPVVTLDSIFRPSIPWLDCFVVSKCA